MKLDIVKIIGDFNEYTSELQFGCDDWSDRQNRKIIAKWFTNKIKEINSLQKK